jgi:CMP-N-acetylneuraminic acid synthetase
MIILIPARRNSKGFPFKNRKLLQQTLNIVPRSMINQTYVSTDDEEIKKRLTKKGVTIHHRSEEVSRDTTSTKDTVCEFLDQFQIKEDEDVLMLYLTYPERKWHHVASAYEEYRNCKAKSLLCKKDVLTHPYLAMRDVGCNRGKQIVEHNMYRRQDYPKCFEISHYISIFKAGEIYNLNNNMYNENTHFHEIPEVVDVDYEEDLKKVSLWL